MGEGGGEREKWRAVLRFRDRLLTCKGRWGDAGQRDISDEKGGLPGELGFGKREEARGEERGREGEGVYSGGGRAGKRARRVGEVGERMWGGEAGGAGEDEEALRDLGLPLSFSSHRRNRR